MSHLKQQDITKPVRVLVQQSGEHQRIEKQEDQENSGEFKEIVPAKAETIALTLLLPFSSI